MSTVETKTVRLGPTTGAGGETNFPYEYLLFNTTDQKLWIKFNGTAVWVEQTAPGDFSITNIGDEAGGEIILTTALLAGDTIVGLAKVPDLQQQSYPPSGLFPGPTVETSLARVVRRLNYIEDKFLGGLFLDDPEARLDAVSLPPPEAGNVLGWANDLKRIINILNIAAGVATSVDELDTDVIKDKMTSNFLTNLTWLLSQVLATNDIAGWVNQMRLTNALTANDPIFEAFGNDADIGVQMKTKGTGIWDFIGNMLLQNLVTLSNSLNEAKAANLASAAQPDLWATAGNLVHITGAVAITSFVAAPQAGLRRHVIADGAFTLTNGANLVVPGGTHVAAVGDSFTVHADTVAISVITNYLKADGTALV